MSIKAWSDGAHKRSGNALIGFVIHQDGQEVSSYRARAPHVNNSHEAEFVALIVLIQRLRDLNINEAEIYVDSTSVVHQIKHISNANGKYKKYVDLINNINVKYNISWIKRKYNEADKLCKIQNIKQAYNQSFDDIMQLGDEYGQNYYLH